MRGLICQQALDLFPLFFILIFQKALILLIYFHLIHYFGNFCNFGWHQWVFFLFDFLNALTPRYPRSLTDQFFLSIYRGVILTFLYLFSHLLLFPFLSHIPSIFTILQNLYELIICHILSHALALIPLCSDPLTKIIHINASNIS